MGKKKSKSKKKYPQKLKREEEGSLYAQFSVPGMIVLIMLFLTIILSGIYCIPPLQIIGFFFGALVFLYLPGRFILNLLKWGDNPVSLTVLSLLIGMACSPIIYFLARTIKQEWIFVVIIALMAFYPVITKVYQGGFTGIKSNPERFKNLFINFSSLLTKKNIRIIEFFFPRGWWKGFIVLLILFLMLHLSFFTDLKIHKNGEYQLRTSHMTETIFHLGIINNLRHSFPPSYPYASGHQLSYHIDTHLLAEMFSRYAGIDTPIMTFYFLPLLFYLMIAAVPAVFFYHLHANINFSLLFGLLIFGTDFSFIPAIWSNWPAQYPWTLTFKSTIWSLCNIGGSLPAIPIFFGAALAFQRFFSEHKIQYLIIFSLLAIAAFRVKGSLGPHILAAAIPAAIFIGWKYKDGNWWKVLPFSVAALLLIGLDLALKPKNEMLVLLWKPFDGLIYSAERLGIESWLYAARHPLDSPFILLIALLFYFIGTMGVRILCVKPAFDIIRKKITQPVVPFLLIFVFSGIILSDLIFLGGKYSKNNDAGWFAAQSLFAASYFAPAIACSISKKKQQMIVTLLIILLSIPTTINFFKLRNDSQYTTITQNQIEVVNYIKKNTPGDSVILEAPNFKIPSLVSNFAGRLSILSAFRSFCTTALSPEEIKDRTKDISNFFNGHYKGDRKKILNKYHVKYLLIPKPWCNFFNRFPWVTDIFSNNDFIIYKINEAIQESELRNHNPE